MSNRPTPLVALSVAVLATLGGCVREPTASRDDAKPPSTIVLVTIDTLRADHLPFHGYPRDTAPFLDRLAGESALFKRCLSASATTAPSHASIFTSLPPSLHGLVRNGQHLDESIPTLAESLAAKGYETAAFTSVSFLRGVKKGFETFQTRTKDDAAAKKTSLTIGAYLPADVIVDRAAEWLGRLKPDAKAFLWVHVYDVHQWKSDDVPPEALAELRRRDAADENAPESYGQLAVDRYAADPEAQRWKPAQFKTLIDNYDAQLVFVDGQLERLYESAREFGRASDALWLITSDHGEGLGSHGYESHGKFLYEEQLHIPLIAHFSDDRYAGQVREELVRTVDLFATVEELVGQGASPHARGRSLVPLLTADRGREPHRLAFAERRPVDDNKIGMGWTDESLHSVQSQRHKYILHGASKDEFYDLREDPLELVNRIADPSKVRDDLKSRLEVHARLLSDEGRTMGEIDPAYLEELEQLGYLK